MRLRSLLFVPGDRPDQMLKALRSGADALILDLEDSVALQRKTEARAHVVAFLKTQQRALRLFVRINSLGSGMVPLDLAAIAHAAPDAVVVPKTEGAQSIIELHAQLHEANMSSTLLLPIATETPLAMFRLGEYATVASSLVGLTWGAEDLSAAVGAESARERDGRFTPPYEVARSMLLFAAYAAAVPAIETVYPNFRDLQGLTEYAQRGARDGFVGMMAIHPTQVPIINAAFTPSLEVVERARRIVAAFAAQPTAGVLNVDGAMLDAPHLKQAQRILAQATDA